MGAALEPGRAGGNRSNAGKQPSNRHILPWRIADYGHCVLVPQLFVARRFGCDLSEFPTLLRIDAACAILDPFQAAHPSRQMDANN